MVKAFGIFSGGLDSILAAKIIENEGYVPTLITFVSPFFPAEKAVETAKKLALPLKLIDITEKLLPLIKKPQFRLGKNLNPCIDCHALMFRMAGEVLLEAGGEGFIFSGEVLGQRPLSQNKNALKSVSIASGEASKIVRPLSAKLLPPSEAELKGYLKRDNLLDLSGRSRTKQFELAKKFNVISFPTPANGCLLTDRGFSKRLKWLLDLPLAKRNDWPSSDLIELLKYGRMFFTNNEAFILVGRNKSDNEALLKKKRDIDWTLQVEGYPGPIVLLPKITEDSFNVQTLDLAKKLAVAYSDAEKGVLAKVKVKTADTIVEESTILVEEIDKFQDYLLLNN